MSVYNRIRDMVEATPFIDTHEHLIEESARLKGSHPKAWLFPCNDWSYLLLHYFSDDLASAGMSVEARKKLFSPEESAEAKFHLVEPYWQRAKHTGYGQAVRYTLQGLYGEDDLTIESVPRLAEKYHALVRPGFYRHVIQEKSHVEVCQVNSLETVFLQTEQPDLLHQDIGFPPLCTGLDLSLIQKDLGKPAKTLEDWLAYIDWVFEKWGPHAVAAKNQSAYSRRLNYQRVERSDAEPLFARLASGGHLSSHDLTTLQDYLFYYCVQKATEQGLPVKLHTGYYAGHGNMPLERVRQNAGDLCNLLRDFPETTFVLMHIGYPYQDEFIALAKHYPNVTIDLCWAWIINPVACVRFVKEYLLAAPANKLFTFGGDYFPVECIYGHSRVARLGLSQALTELVETGWVREGEMPELVARLMHQNAREKFPKR